MSNFKRHENAVERKRSARNLVKSILEMKGITEEHRKTMLSHGLWLLTEAEWTNKYDTRFCSETIFYNATLPKEEKRHDHIFQRKNMVELLRKTPDDIDQILDNAEGCTITKAEHKDLDKYKNHYGWKRYAEAKIIVIDRDTGQPYKLPIS